MPPDPPSRNYAPSALVVHALRAHTRESLFSGFIFLGAAEFFEPIANSVCPSLMLPNICFKHTCCGYRTLKTQIFHILIQVTLFSSFHPTVRPIGVQAYLFVDNKHGNLCPILTAEEHLFSLEARGVEFLHLDGLEDWRSQRFLGQVTAIYNTRCEERWKLIEHLKFNATYIISNHWWCLS